MNSTISQYQQNIK